jgi:hypothetical protein
MKPILFTLLLALASSTYAHQDTPADKAMNAGYGDAEEFFLSHPRQEIIRILQHALDIGFPIPVMKSDEYSTNEALRTIYYLSFNTHIDELLRYGLARSSLRSLNRKSCGCFGREAKTRWICILSAVVDSIRRMTPEELFTAALGLGRQWRVAECRFEGEPKRLELRLEHVPGGTFRVSSL